MHISLVEKVKAAGIIGCGGAGFPTHVKLNAKVEYVIANGAECEPLIESDITLVQEYGDRILQGLDLVVKQTGAVRGIFAIKGKHKHAAHVIKDEIKKYPALELRLIKDIYPAGDEFLLVHEVLNLTVPERGIPLEVGVVVSNVGSLYHIANAQSGIPFTSRLVTITGEINNPQVLHVPIGTSFEDLINACNGKKPEGTVILHNGPMMGSLTGSHVLKTTSAIMLFPEHSRVINMKKTPINHRIKIAQSVCDQCFTCTMVCSRGLLGHALEPNKIVKAVNAYNDMDAEIIKSAMLCSECGLCELYCDMGISPVALNKEIKKQFMQAKKVPTRSASRKYTTHPMRDYRLVSANRIMSRLGLSKYSEALPFNPTLLNVDKVKIFMKQHTGAPAVPVVKVGDKVKKGDLIGEIPEGQLGARYHASIDGTVTEVNDVAIVICK